MIIPVRGALLALCLTIAGLVVASTGSTALAAGASGLGAPPGAVHCGLVKTHGQSWTVFAKRVTCSVALKWLPKMIVAPERLGGGWTGPPGWMCQKIARDTGGLSEGICINKSGAEMAWLRYH